MKFALKLLSGLLASAMVLPAAFAQTSTPPPPPAGTDTPPPPYGGTRGGGPEHRVQMLQQALNLTPDQTTQVKALLETERTKMEALRSNTALTQDDRRSQMMAIHGDTTTKMHALLSTEQATKYDSLEARMRQRRQDGGNPPPPPPPGPGNL